MKIAIFLVLVASGYGAYKMPLGKMGGGSRQKVIAIATAILLTSPFFLFGSLWLVQALGQTDGTNLTAVGALIVGFGACYLLAAQVISSRMLYGLFQSSVTLSSRAASADRESQESKS